MNAFIVPHETLLMLCNSCLTDIAYNTSLMGLLDKIRDGVRYFMRGIARFLNKLTGGKLSPNTVTIVGLLAHVPIAWLIATGRNNILAAVLLIIFGLFDALDGEIARLQKRSSAAGMLLDASTDRIKEVFLYMGVGVALVFPPRIFDVFIGYSLRGPDVGEQYILALVIAACGGSLLVSYIKAKGETAVKDKNLSPNEINRLFQDGLARFEIRMVLLIIGLFFDQLLLAVLVIAVLSWWTAISRLIKISKKLSDVQD